MLSAEMPRYEMVGLGGHYPLDRRLERGVNPLDQLVEIAIARDRVVWDVHAGDVVSDARRPHLIVFRLHDGVCRGGYDPEGAAPAEDVRHGCLLEPAGLDVELALCLGELVEMRG